MNPSCIREVNASKSGCVVIASRSAVVRSKIAVLILAMTAMVLSLRQGQVSLSRFDTCSVG